MDGTGSGGKYAAKCPAHEDHKRSLSITDKDGKTLVKCHAGCSQADVIAALSDKGLWKQNVRNSSEWVPWTLGRRYHASWGNPVVEYVYADESGSELFRCIRFEPKNFRQGHFDNSGKWLWSLKGVRLVPYRLPEVLSAVKANRVVVLAEGEKDADNLAALDVCATTLPMGANKPWQAAYTEALRGANIVIIADNDQSGRMHANNVASELSMVGIQSRVLVLPGDGKDASDWIAAGGTKEQLKELTASVEAWSQSPVKQASTAPPDLGLTLDDDEKGTQTQVLLQLARCAEIWRTSEDRAYATIPIAQHKEHWPLEGRHFKLWLQRQFYLSKEKMPRPQALTDAIDTLIGAALFGSVQHDVALRVAGGEHEIFVDLCNDKWEAVRITAAGFEVASDPPVKFRRAAGMAALPYPEKNGSLLALRRFLHCSDDDFKVIVSWLLAAFRPTGPYPLLEIGGEHGSAKSTTTKILKRLVDPNVAATNSPPGEPRDIAVSAMNEWALAYDNLSALTTELSDAFCRVATGGAFKLRKLHTDSEQCIFQLLRPVVWNGIAGIASKPDLLNRTLKVSLPPISASERKDEGAFWKEFDEQAPALLGAVFSTISGALAAMPNCTLAEKPRLADFALWMVAAESILSREPGLNWPAGSFMQLFTMREQESAASSLDTDDLGQAVIEVIDGAIGNQWEGNVQELLSKLNAVVDEQVRKSRYWVNRNTLKARLLRINPLLRSQGYEAEYRATAARRLYILTKKNKVQGCQEISNGLQSEQLQLTPSARYAVSELSDDSYLSGDDDE
jgi:hypothetical protein